VDLQVVEQASEVAVSLATCSRVPTLGIMIGNWPAFNTVAALAADVAILVADVAILVADVAILVALVAMRWSPPAA
jgi:hypothetical protein